MNNLKIEVDTLGNYICHCTQQYMLQIVKDSDEATIKEIERYCEEHNIIPYFISEDILRSVLKLGIQEYNKRQLETGNAASISNMEDKTKKAIDNLIGGEKIWTKKH